MDGLISMYTDDSLLSGNRAMPILGKKGKWILYIPGITITLNLIAVYTRLAHQDLSFKIQASTTTYRD